MCVEADIIRTSHTTTESILCRIYRVAVSEYVVSGDKIKFERWEQARGSRCYLTPGAIELSKLFRRVNQVLTGDS